MSESSIIIIEEEKSSADDLRHSLQEFGYSVIGIEESGDKTVKIFALPMPEPDPFANILSKHDTTLLILCEGLKNDTISQKEINLLIKVSFKLGLARVKKNINKIFNLSQRWNLSPDDIAVEGISNLFIMNAKREMLNIRYSILNWEEPLATSMDALFFLNKTVSLCIDQQINKMFREADPVFSKVLDAVNFAIRKYDYKKIDYNGTVCLIKCGSGPVAGTVIGYDEFMNLPLDLSLSKQEMLAYLTSHLDENTDHFPAVPLNPFIERLLGSSQEQEDAFQLQTPSHFSRISMDDLIFTSLEKTICKLKSTYHATGKLSGHETDLISAALTDVAMDLREGNTIWQLSDYIKYYKKDLTKEEYKENYQYIIEYLVKGFKQMLVRRLKNK